MRISQITIGVSRTVNLGNYNSLKIEGLVTVDLLEDDRIEDARDLATKEIKEQLKTAYSKFKPKEK